jgi:hypothetical protein
MNTTSVTKTGLRKRPTLEAIVDYLANGQETIKYPDRFAKFIRNHPYLTQLDGEGMMEMQEQQENVWREQVREQRVRELAEAGTQSAPEIRAQLRSLGIQASTSARDQAAQARPSARDQEAQSSRDVRMSEAQTDPEVRTQLRSERGMTSETTPFSYRTELRSERGMTSETTGFSFRTQLRREQAMISNLQTFLLNQDRNIAEEMDTTAEELRKRVREAEERETKKRANVRDLVVKNLGSDPGPIPFAAAAASSSSSAAAPPASSVPKSKRSVVRSRSPANKTTDKQDAKGNTKTESAAPPKMSPNPFSPPKATPPKTATPTPPPKTTTTQPTKGVKQDMKTKGNQESKPQFGTKIDKSNDAVYWEKQNKGYLLDQLALRGYRGDTKKTARMTKKKLAELIVTFPVK